MRTNKKGSLNLSINAIVVLILAITMLGLGLAFMRNIFGSATEEFSEVSGTVKKQMIDQMKESNQIVDLSRPKVSIKPGENTQVFIGFKNDDSGVKTFTIDSASDSDVTSLVGSGDNCLVDGSKVSLEFKQTATEVLGGDVVVLPINIKAGSNSEEDTCFYELKITDNAAETIIMELTVDVTI
jgi:hypothetical protein